MQTNVETRRSQPGDGASDENGNLNNEHQIVTPRADLGRWGDVEEEESDGDMEVEEVRINAMSPNGADQVPTEGLTSDVARDRSDASLCSKNMNVNLIFNGLGANGVAVRMNTGHAASVVTRSLGRIEVTFEDVVVVDASLAKQGGAFSEVGKCPPRRNVGRQNKQVDSTSARDTWKN
ncbi:hypothetical protein NE237_032917 [Protea cynaroides]|uniref:Uncharacterized protein n=1 Tax=Protea cynaroides TaxID=273540 RepID=A0A9Q0R429_9MAGN|nr:hypothetical protein NE237_032917 [Protea cynaroides]